MKKILIIPSWYPSEEFPSIGVFFKEQAELLADRYDIRILIVEWTAIGRRRAPYSWAVRKLFGPKLASYKVFREPGHLAAINAKFEVASTRRLDRKQDFQSEANQLREVLTRINWLPDLVHSHCAIQAGTVGSSLAKDLRIPHALTEHQHIIQAYFDRKAWSAALACYQDASHVIAVSHFQKQMMLMNGAKCDPVVLGNLVDERLFPLAPEIDDHHQIRIIFIGMASPLKDFETFFDSVSRASAISQKPISVKIVCADNKDRVEDLKTRASKICAVSLEIIPSASRTEIASLISWSTMLVSTSIAETFGVSVCEALMCGRPVVVTASGGVSDFVKDGWNGYIVPIKDADTIARRIVDVAERKISATRQEIRHAVIQSYGTSIFREAISRIYG